MSNNVSKALEASYDVLLKFEKKMDDIDRKILSTAKQVREMSKPGTGSTSPKDVTSTIKKNQQFTEQLNAELKEQERLEKALIAQIAKKTLSMESTSKALAKQRVEQQIINKVNKEDAILTSKLTTEKQKAAAELAKLNREYDDLAIKQARYNNLTEDQVKEMDRLQKEALELNTTLKKVEQGSGRFGRSVGDYKTAFDGLGFSITQITREAPAFANSIQTGFMAISNNIPMLVDEINRLRTSNKALAAEGKPTKSVLKSLGNAIVSWQTAISIGVTVLTVYGKQLFDLAFGLSAAEKAQKELNKELAKSEAEARAASESYRSLSDIILDTTQNETVRNEALKELNKEIPETTKFTLEMLDANNGVNDATVEFIKLTDSYVKAVQARAKSEIFARKAVEAEIKLEEQRAQSVQDQSKWYEKLAGSVFNTSIQYSMAGKRIGKENAAMEETIETLNEKQKEQLVLALELEKGLQGLEKGAGSAGKKNAEVSTILQQLAISAELSKDAISQMFIDGIISAEEFSNRINDINEAIENLSFLNQDAEALSGLMDGLEGTGVMIKTELFDPIEDYSNKLVNLPWEESLQRATAFFGEMGNLAGAFFDGNIQRIDEEIAANDLKYAKLLEAEGLSNDQRNQLEAEQELKRQQLEDRKREEQRKKATIDKAFNATQVISNTAVAISKTLAETGVFGIPLTALVAAQGALQLATVLAQPLPQYKTGREGGREEFAVLGDGGKHEPILDKHGRLKGVSPDVPTLTYLQRGDTVLPSLDRLLERNGIGYFNENAIMNNGMALSERNLFNRMKYPGKPSNNNNASMIISKEIKSGFSNIKIPKQKDFDYNKMAKALALEIEARNR